ncbi:MAG: hypothetical protein K5755_04705 [Clostridiales bacterium]|nr:hypothetical protein [Clostridiales bacterium]
MKKIIAVLLVFVMLFVMSSCSLIDKVLPSKQGDNTTTPTEKQTEMVDENLIDVDFTIPASMFTEENPATDVLTEEQKAQGFKKAVVNADGSVTYTMSKKAYRELQESIRSQTRESLESFKTDYPCIRSLEYDDNFTNVNVFVNRSEYEGGFNFMLAFGVGMVCQVCQVYTGVSQDQRSVDVNIIDVDTNESINTAHYPVQENG